MASDTKSDVLQRLNALGTMIDELHDGIEGESADMFWRSIGYAQETLDDIEPRVAGLYVIAKALKKRNAGREASTGSAGHASSGQPAPRVPTNPEESTRE